MKKSLGENRRSINLLHSLSVNQDTKYPNARSDDSKEKLLKLCVQQAGQERRANAAKKVPHMYRINVKTQL